MPHYICTLRELRNIGEIIDKLIAASLSKDREHKYIVDLLSGIWGEDYKLHAEELKQESDNFRRIYKRVYVNDII